MSKYYNQAQQQYDQSYNTKVEALKNQTAQNQLNLEQQKGGINQNYDKQVSNQNLNNKKSKNNLSNTMLGRGLANSSIAVSGLAESDQINNRIVGDINDARRGDLNNIDQQKSLLAQNLNNMLSQMSADREDGIWALARQLEDRDFDKNFKNQQLGLQREQFQAEQAFKQQQLAMQQSEADFRRQQYQDKKQASKENPQEALANMRYMVSSNKKTPEEKLADLQYFQTIYDGVDGMSYVNKETKYHIDTLKRQIAQQSSAQVPTSKPKSGRSWGRSDAY